MPHFIRGGTYCDGTQNDDGSFTSGDTRFALNITYNYSQHLAHAFGDERGVRSIYGLTGAESIPLLKAAIALLKDDVHEDYWEPTEGNTKRALCGLLALAQMRPDGVWEGD